MMSRKGFTLQSGVNVALIVIILMLVGWNIAIVSHDSHHTEKEQVHTRERRDAAPQQSAPQQSAPQQSAPQLTAAASLFTRWGRTHCPADTQQIYQGIAAGSLSTQTGGGSNHLCMPHDPIYAEYTVKADKHGELYGGEYQTVVTAQNTPFSTQNARLINDHNVPCAVCRAAHATVMMLPGRTECYDGWRFLYEGYLTSAHSAHKGRTMFLCMDADPEADESGYRNELSSGFHQVEGVCGALPCPPYEPGRELTCVVCGK